MRLNAGQRQLQHAQRPVHTRLLSPAYSPKSYQCDGSRFAEPWHAFESGWDELSNLGQENMRNCCLVSDCRVRIGGVEAFDFLPQSAGVTGTWRGVFWLRPRPDHVHHDASTCAATLRTRDCLCSAADLVATRAKWRATSHSARTMDHKAGQSSDQKRSSRGFQEMRAVALIEALVGRPRRSPLLSTRTFQAGSEAGEEGPWCMVARKMVCWGCWRANVKRTQTQTHRHRQLKRLKERC